MPAIVPHTSTYALTNVTLSYALELADKGLHALQNNPALRRGLNTYKGQVLHPGVAAAFGLPCANLEEPVEAVV
jgi:alanine dehydrogenase